MLDCGVLYANIVLMLQVVFGKGGNGSFLFLPASLFQFSYSLSNLFMHAGYFISSRVK